MFNVTLHCGIDLDDFPRSMSKLIIHSKVDSLASVCEYRWKFFLIIMKLPLCQDILATGPSSTPWTQFYTCLIHSKHSASGFCNEIILNCFFVLLNRYPNSFVDLCLKTAACAQIHIRYCPSKLSLN